MKRKIRLYRTVQILCDLFVPAALVYIGVLCYYMSKGYEAGWPARYCLPRITLACALLLMEPHIWNACEDKIEHEQRRAYNELVRSGLVPHDTRKGGRRNESGKSYHRNVG